MTEAQFIQKYRKIFKDKYNGYKLRDNQFLFIDTLVEQDIDVAEQTEIDAFNEAIDKIKTFSEGYGPYFCDDIKVAQKEIDKLKQENLNIVKQLKNKIKHL